MDVKCDLCGAVLTVDDSLYNTQVKCGQCGEPVLAVPAPEVSTLPVVVEMDQMPVSTPPPPPAQVQYVPHPHSTPPAPEAPEAQSNTVNVVNQAGPNSFQSCMVFLGVVFLVIFIFFIVGLITAGAK